MAGVCRLQSLSADAGMHPESMSWVGRLLSGGAGFIWSHGRDSRYITMSPLPLFPPLFLRFLLASCFPLFRFPCCRAAPCVLPAMSPPCPRGLGRCLACTTFGLICLPACARRLPRRPGAPLEHVNRSGLKQQSRTLPEDGSPQTLLASHDCSWMVMRWSRSV